MSNKALMTLLTDRRTLVAQLLLGAVLLSGCLTPKSNRTVVIGTYAEFAPVCYKDKAGRLVGMDPDILNAFADKYGYQLKWKEFGFDGLWARPAKGECDIAASGISHLESRITKGSVFSEPYFIVNRSILIRSEDAAFLKTIKDFAGKKIGITAATTGAYDAEDRAPTNARLVPYELEEKAVTALLKGEIDGLARGEVASRFIASEHPGRLAVTDIHPLPEPEYFVFAVTESRPDLLADLNQFIKQGHQSGTLKSLTGKYVK